MELKIVPDPLVFPGFDPDRSTLHVRPPLDISSQARQLCKDVQDMTDGLDILRQQLHAGMISIAEARAMLGGL